jgi:hypothetical protein
MSRLVISYKTVCAIAYIDAKLNKPLRNKAFTSVISAESSEIQALFCAL